MCRALVAAALPEDRPSVVILDEMQYLIGNDSGFEGTLQKLFDRELSRRPVLLLCIGSDLAMMEALNSYGRPFHQRATEMVIPPELEQVVMDCLEKDRERRPKSAAELSLRLAACPTREQWTGQRAERWWHTHLPSHASERPIAEALLSRESAPREWRELRPRGRRVGIG